MTPVTHLPPCLNKELDRLGLRRRLAYAYSLLGLGQGISPLGLLKLLFPFAHATILILLKRAESSCDPK